MLSFYVIAVALSTQARPILWKPFPVVLLCDQFHSKHSDNHSKDTELDHYEVSYTECLEPPRVFQSTIMGFRSNLKAYF